MEGFEVKKAKSLFNSTIEASLRSNLPVSKKMFFKTTLLSIEIACRGTSFWNGSKVLRVSSMKPSEKNKYPFLEAFKAYCLPAGKDTKYSPVEALE